MTLSSDEIYLSLAAAGRLLRQCICELLDVSIRPTGLTSLSILMIHEPAQFNELRKLIAYHLKRRGLETHGKPFPLVGNTLVQEISVYLSAHAKPLRAMRANCEEPKPEAFLLEESKTFYKGDTSVPSVPSRFRNEQRASLTETKP